MINVFAAEDRRSKQGNSENIPLVKLSPDTVARAGIHVKVKVWQLRSGTDSYEREKTHADIYREKHMTNSIGQDPVTASHPRKKPERYVRVKHSPGGTRRC